ncbi:hypothetical protein Trydic_g12078 [Trypoxylus dichotomus]
MDRSGVGVVSFDRYGSEVLFLSQLSGYHALEQCAIRNRYNLAPLTPVETGNQLLRGSIHSDKPRVHQDKGMKSVDLSGHVRTLRELELQSWNHNGVLRANMR